MEEIGTKAAGFFVVWQTSADDGYQHAITDEEFTFGKGTTEGRFEAVCGHYMVLADSFKAPGRFCPRCVVFVRARMSMRPLDQRLTVVRKSVFSRFRSMFCSRPRHRATWKTPELVELYALLTKHFNTHVPDEDSRECQSCRHPWPCPQVRLAYRLREGF